MRELNNPLGRKRRCRQGAVYSKGTGEGAASGGSQASLILVALAFGANPLCRGRRFKRLIGEHKLLMSESPRTTLHARRYFQYFPRDLFADLFGAGLQTQDSFEVRPRWRRGGDFLRGGPQLQTRSAHIWRDDAVVRGCDFSFGVSR